MHLTSFFRRACLLLCLVILSMLTYAQRSINGRILSAETQKPVPGATIKVKGANRQAITDENGNFSITATDNETLIITSIGFAALEVKASANISNLVLATHQSRTE